MLIVYYHCIYVSYEYTTIYCGFQFLPLQCFCQHSYACLSVIVSKSFSRAVFPNFFHIWHLKKTILVYLTEVKGQGCLELAWKFFMISCPATENLSGLIHWHAHSICATWALEHAPFRKLCSGAVLLSVVWRPAPVHKLLVTNPGPCKVERNHLETFIVIWCSLNILLFY